MFKFEVGNGLDVQAWCSKQVPWAFLSQGANNVPPRAISRTPGSSGLLPTNLRAFKIVRFSRCCTPVIIDLVLPGYSVSTLQGDSFLGL